MRHYQEENKNSAGDYDRTLNQRLSYGKFVKFSTCIFQRFHAHIIDR